MKLNTHNNPPQNKRPKKAAKPQKVKKVHDPKVTERNKQARMEREKLRQLKAKNKKLTVPHGHTRMMRRLDERNMQEIRELEHQRMMDHGIIRQQFVLAGLIKPKANETQPS